MSQAEIQEESFSSDEEFDDEEDSASSSDADAKLEESDVFDIEFFKCYSALKKKDAKIYDQNVKFFNEPASDSDDEDATCKVDNQEPKESLLGLDKASTSKPKMTLLDHQLKMAKEGYDEAETLLKPKIDLNQPVSQSFYDKELEEIRKSIAKVSENVDTDSDDELLVVKGSDARPPKPEKKIEAMLDQLEKDEDEDISHLKQIWSNPENLTDEDKFLRDYILNKRYLAKDLNENDKKHGFFSKNLDELSDVESEEGEDKARKRKVDHHSDEKDFDKIARVPRNSTKTIRDLVEKREKKEKRLKKLEKEKKKRNNLKNADCEDIVGDLPTRFHYRETEPNDYGLSAEELLMATDEELEKWVSLKDAISCRSREEELEYKQKFEKKRNDLELKKKIFQSIYGEPDADNSKSKDDTASSKRSKKEMDDEVPSTNEKLDEDMDEPNRKKAKVDPISLKRDKKKKHKRRGLNHKKFSKAGVAPDRLLSYGLSKSKLKKSKLL